MASDSSSMKVTVSTSQSGASSLVLAVVEMDTKFCLSSTSKENGTVLAEEVPVVVHADGGLVPVLTGEGPGVVLTEEVIVGLPSWTYKSVAAAPRSRPIRQCRDRQKDPC